MATGGFDFAALRRALERSDAATLAALYAEDAEMTIVDRNRPPSAPMRLLGRPAIAGFWQDVCSREMTHAVGDEVVGSLEPTGLRPRILDRLFEGGISLPEELVSLFPAARARIGENTGEWYH